MTVDQSSGLDLSLYLVTSSDNLSPGSTIQSTVEAAIKGGVTIVQLREKQSNTQAFLKLAIELKEICHRQIESPVKFIVNDRIDIALGSNADGVHLGQDDMPIEIARKILGNQSIIGISVNTIQEALRGIEGGADYLGIGTCWPTGTKVIPDHKVIGPRGVKKIRDELARRGLKIPVVTIGGIKTTNLRRTLHGCVSTISGLEPLGGVAVVSAIMSSPQPQQAALEFRKIINHFNQTIQQKNQISNQTSNFNQSYLDQMISYLIPSRPVDQPRQVIHHLTNTVVQNDCANLTLSLNCSPIMSSNVEEAQELVKSLPGALLLNLGTLHQTQVEAMTLAGQTANLLSKPIICDPVGVGASEFRQKLTSRLLNDVQMSIIKGNQGEIATLAEQSGARSCGVDTMGSLSDPARVVRDLARKERCIVVMTGPIDYVSNGVEVVKLENGVEMLSSITGSGCMAGSAIACFAAKAQFFKDLRPTWIMEQNPTMIEADLFAASICGISSLNIAAELAMKRDTVTGPNSLRAALIDELFNLTETKIKAMIKIQSVLVDL